MDEFPPIERARVAWWLVVAVLGGVFAFVLYSFVGTFVLALFAYYGMRPVDRRVRRVVGDRRLAAVVTLFGFLLPFILLLGLLAVRALGEAAVFTEGGQIPQILRAYFDVSSVSQLERQVVRALVENPASVLGLGSGQVTEQVRFGFRLLGAMATGALHVFLALTLAYFLLRDDDRFADWFRTYVADEGTTTYAYARTVDADLETIYSGNILTLLVVAVVAGGVYNGFNLVAPPALTIPLPTVLALLTGATSLVPIVVAKLVYVPVVAYVSLQASRLDGGAFTYPLALLLVSVVLLDLLPQMVVRPYLSGRDSHMGLVLFAYVFGTLLFGWYGLFLGPLVLVVMVQAVRLVVPELVHGEPVRPTVSGAEGFGVDPAELGLADVDDDEADDSG